MRTLVKAILTIAVVGGFLAGSQSADAAFRVRITTASGSHTMTDQDVGNPVFNDSNGAVGLIVTSNAVAIDGFLVTVTATSKPILPAGGTPGVFQLNVTSFTVQSLGAGGAISIAVTDTGFGTPGFTEGTYRLTVGGETENGTATFTSHRDLANTEFGTGAGTLLDSMGPLGPGGFTATRTGAVSIDSQFSITSISAYNFAGAGSGSADFRTTITGVPLPGGVILALTGIPALGLGAWIRRRKAVVAA